MFVVKPQLWSESNLKTATAISQSAILRKAFANSTFLFLLFLFVIAFIIRAVFPDTSYFFWDETVYMLHGKLFIGQAAAYSEAFLRPPLLPLLLAPFASLPQYLYELSSRFMVAFLNSLVVLPVYYLAKAVFSRKTAAIAAIVVALLPVQIVNSRWVMTDALGALLAFSSVTAYLIGLGKEKKLLVYAGGLLAGLAILMKFTNLLLVVLLLPLLAANIRRSFRAIALSALFFILTLLPYLIFNTASFGNPFYSFSSAFFVVAQHDPVTPGFFLYLLKDVFGLAAVFLAAGVALSALGILGSFSSRVKPGQGKLAAGLLPYLLYCLIVAALYSFFIINRGIVKPPGIEWEAERFLLLPVLFAAPFIGFGAVRLLGLAGSGRLAVAVKPAATVLVIAATVFSLYPQLIRAYTPAIAYEDGLRAATKDVGLYLSSSGIAEFGCLGNCPPVAYYSGKKMRIYFRLQDLEAVNHSVNVLFDGNVANVSSDYKAVKDFCSGSHCAHLLGLQRS